MFTYLESATDEQWKDISAEAGVTEESLKNDVEDLKKWMEKQPHLPNTTDDEILINFLVWTKNSMERTKKYLEMYYINRLLMSDIYLNRDPKSKDLDNFFKVACNIPLRKLTPDGNRIYVFKIFEGIKHNQPKPEIFLELITLLMDYAVKNDRNKSVIYIYDLANIPLAYSAQLFTILKRYITYGTGSCPVRLQKVYIMNLNPIIETLVDAGISFMKKKVADRVQIWTKEPQDLVEVLPKHALPSDYGGDEPSLVELIDMFHRSLKEFSSWVEREKQITADLSKKPKNSLLNNDLIADYGVEGSFRKISID